MTTEALRLGRFGVPFISGARPRELPRTSVIEPAMQVATATREPKSGEIPWYHGELAVKTFQSALDIDPEEPTPKDREKTDTLHHILREFLYEEINNIETFRGADGTAIPYTRINITRFARRIYEEYGGRIPQADGRIEREEEHPTSPKNVKYVTFGSFLTPQNGHPFTYVEPAMQQTLRWVGSIATAIREGREVPEVEVITLGSPTNDRWGGITEEYAQKVEEKPFETLASSYADLIAATVPETPEDREQTIYRFYGHSMGGRLAEPTGEVLVSRQILTQERGQEGMPFLQSINLESTPGWNKKRVQGQVPVGFAIFVLDGFRKNKDVMKTASLEKSFLGDVEAVLEERDIHSLSKQERKRQKRWKKAAIKALRRKLPEPPTAASVKVTHWRGTSDPILYSRRWNREMEEEKARRKESWMKRRGKKREDTYMDKSVRYVEPLNTYEWATEGGHMLQGFFSPREMTAWDRSLTRFLKAVNT